MNNHGAHSNKAIWVEKVEKTPVGIATSMLSNSFKVSNEYYRSCLPIDNFNKII